MVVWYEFCISFLSWNSARGAYRAIAGIAGAIAGLRVLHLMKLKRINDKKKAEIISRTEILTFLMPNLKMQYNRLYHSRIYSK